MKINIQCECGAELTYSSASGVATTDEPIFKIRPCSNCKMKAEGFAFKHGWNSGFNVCIEEMNRTGKTPSPV